MFQNCSSLENLFPLVQSTQQSRHSTRTAKREESLATASAGSRPWCHPRGTGFRHIHNARVVGAGKLPPSFQKAWEARWYNPDRALWQGKALSVTLKVHWRPQKFGENRNMDCLRKTATERAPERSHGSYNHWQYLRGKAVQAPWASHLATDCLLYYTWNYRT